MHLVLAAVLVTLALTAAIVPVLVLSLAEPGWRKHRHTTHHRPDPTTDPVPTPIWQAWVDTDTLRRHEEDTRQLVDNPR